MVWQCARVLQWILILTGMWMAGSIQAAESVVESAREIPVAAEVDVVVVGGSTGAVAAAVAAAQQGATVFLAAPYPYLGDDMTATLQLWLEPGETPRGPLAWSIYDDQRVQAEEPNRLPFRYEASAPSAELHRDTDPPSRLTDAQWSSAAQHSVQYETDTSIVADLGDAQPIERVRVVVFRRGASADPASGFDVGKMTVSTSDDRTQWKQRDTFDNNLPLEDISVLTLPVHERARYVKFDLQIAPPHRRMLLGEIEILGPAKESTDQGGVVPVPPRPLHVKKVLDDALLTAGVTYLYSCLPTDVLRGERGELCGVVMANRAGRQAVVAKRIIDATPTATVARLAGATFRKIPGHETTLRRVVIGGEPHPGPGVEVRQPCVPYTMLFPSETTAVGGTYPVYEYTLKLPTGESYDQFMRADQRARTLSYDPRQQYTSDLPWLVEVEPIESRQATETDQIDQVPLDAFLPAQLEGLFLLSARADVSPSLAVQLARPINLMLHGERIGAAAAEQAKSSGRAEGISVAGQRWNESSLSESLVRGDVRELLQGSRPTGDYRKITQAARHVPVLGRYDVVVIGGGTGGAPAGIAAARQGARTLVVEYLAGLGGVGTEGAIASYYWGNRVGFTATVLDGATRWDVEPKKEWYRRELLEAGADVWFGSIGCGVVAEGNRVLGAVVATPLGRGVVLGNTVVDATGNSDVAAAAGATCLYTDETEFGMQGTGLPGRRLGGSYNNTDFTIVDETDMVDVWHMFVYSKDKYPGAFDQGRLIDTRERRRIVGDYTITVWDEINERTYPDTVVRTWSNFDTHGYTIDPYFLLEHPEEDGIGVSIPLRAMLPRGLEGVIVTGLGISAHRDAVPLIRMQADIQNGGYAAGTAAAMASYAETTVRQVDIRRLQEHLVQIGNLPASVLEEQDSYPVSDETLALAVTQLKEGRGAAVVLTDPQRAMPLLKQAFRTAQGADRLVYARTLATLGCDDGIDVIIEAVRAIPAWDEGWNYRGMGQFGAALSPLDILIMQLGRAGSREALPAILDKAALLDARQDFSHHRAVSLALEMLGDPVAAEPLAALLSKPGMSGHSHLDLPTARQEGVGGGTNAEQTRRESLRELMLARALFRCGDFQGVGQQILESYTRDLRGHLARHAKAVLEAGGK